MHAAIEADTEDGNAALAGRAAGRQGGRRAAVLLRHANPTDVHHDICSDKAFPQRSRSRPSGKLRWCGRRSPPRSKTPAVAHLPERRAAAAASASWTELG